MGDNGGLQLGEDSVGVGLIGRREVGGGMGRRCGLAAWGLGWFGPVTLRSMEAWVGEHEVTKRERKARVTEREREREAFNHRSNKINFFLALVNSVHLSIDVHGNSGAKKNRFSSIDGASFY